MRGKRLWLFVSIAIVAAAVFVRLGIWQLHRREERRVRNALVLSRLRLAESDVESLPRDTSAVRFRRVRVTGTPDYQHELVYAARSYRGSPGVNLLTPVRVAGRDTAVLVNRGWVYAPDGATVDLAKWHDRDSTFSGYVEELPSTDGSAYSDRPNVIARLGYGAVSKALPYPVAPLYVVVLGDSAIAPDRLARLTIPPLDEGPHLNYAIQWFGFALVALAGAGFVIRQARDERSAPAGSPGVSDVPAGRG
ncbi:MAG TPA: SURF1 family protein [Gemmatimonadaceae bacterium]|nr:SURF1 family protein [Gemmatimonadaceae bacterium]